MIKTSVKGLNQVRASLEKKLKEYKDAPSVVVGIRSEAGKHADSNFTVAQIGAVHEFGAANIPQRPFLRPGVAAAEDDYVKIATKYLPKDGIEKTLELIGITAQNSVQGYMVDLRTPPNAPETIARKGSSNPLVDTGQLVNSISYLVTTDGIEEGI